MQLDQVCGAFANGVLGSLSASDFALLQPSLSFVELPVRRQLEIRNRPVENVFFLRRGLASMVISAGAIHSIEVAVVGKEGMTGISLLLESNLAMHQTFMQSSGDGWRIGAGELRDAMSTSVTLHKSLLRFAHVLVNQMTYTALSNARCRLEERLARWLLMANDRLGGNIVDLTHEFLSIMLGVRRPGITVAMNDLEQQGIIETRRGTVLIKDRSKLEEAANGSYGAPEADYRRLILAAESA